MDETELEDLYARYTQHCASAGVGPFERDTVAALVDLITSGSWADALREAHAAESRAPSLPASGRTARLHAAPARSPEPQESPGKPEPLRLG